MEWQFPAQWLPGADGERMLSKLLIVVGARMRDRPHSPALLAALSATGPTSSLEVPGGPSGPWITVIQVMPSPYANEDACRSPRTLHCALATSFQVQCTCSKCLHYIRHTRVSAHSSGLRVNIASMLAKHLTSNVTTAAFTRALRPARHSRALQRNTMASAATDKIVFWDILPAPGGCEPQNSAYFAYRSIVCHKYSDICGRCCWACRSSVWRNAQRTALCDPPTDWYLLVLYMTGLDMAGVATMTNGPGLYICHMTSPPHHQIDLFSLSAKPRG